MATPGGRRYRCSDLRTQYAHPLNWQPHARDPETQFVHVQRSLEEQTRRTPRAQRFVTEQRIVASARLGRGSHPIQKPTSGGACVSKMARSNFRTLERDQIESKNQCSQHEDASTTTHTGDGPRLSIQRQAGRGTVLDGPRSIRLAKPPAHRVPKDRPDSAYARRDTC